MDISDLLAADEFGGAIKGTALDAHDSRIVDCVRSIENFLGKNVRENAEFALHVIKRGDPFSRKNMPAHITGSVLVMDADLRSVLLIHHKILNMWLPPGGHVDPGETAFDAAMREGKEETGMDLIPISESVLDVDIHPIPANEKKGEGPHYHVDLCFLAHAVDQDTIKVNEDECLGYQWADIEAVALRADSIGRCARLAMARLCMY